MRTRRIVLTLAVVIPVVILVIAGWLIHRPRWTPRLDDPSPAVRAAAIRSLSPSGNERALIKALDDEDSDVRLVAVMALADKWGSRNIGRREEVAEALVCVLDDDHSGVWTQAIESLSWLRADAWPAIREALTSENPRIRGRALAALRHHPKDLDWWAVKMADSVAPILRARLDDPDPEVRRQARRVLNWLER